MSIGKDVNELKDPVYNDNRLPGSYGQILREAPYIKSEQERAAKAEEAAKLPNNIENNKYEETGSAAMAPPVKPVITSRPIGGVHKRRKTKKSRRNKRSKRRRTHRRRR